jgi:hypothetical protein
MQPPPTSQKVTGSMNRNIAVISHSGGDACQYYRGLGPMRELRRLDIDVTNIKNEISWLELSGSDIGFMQRPYTPQHVAVAKLIKQQMPLWIDFDDLLTAVPESNPSYITYAADKTHESIARLVHLADVVTVSTEALKTYLGREDIRVIPNAYNDYRLPTERNVVKRKGKIVLWRGTNSHAGDITAHKDAINALIKHNPDTRFIFVGSIPWMLDLSAENMDHVAAQTMYEYFQLVDELAPDMMIVPLEDNVFNQCKSNIAWIETARNGTTVVAPLWGSWAAPGVCGYTDDFFTTANDALNNGGKDWAGWDYVKENLLLSKINELRAEVVRDFT